MKKEKPLDIEHLKKVDERIKEEGNVGKVKLGSILSKIGKSKAKTKKIKGKDSS